QGSMALSRNNREDVIPTAAPLPTPHVTPAQAGAHGALPHHREDGMPTAPPPPHVTPAQAGAHGPLPNHREDVWSMKWAAATTISANLATTPGFGNVR